MSDYGIRISKPGKSALSANAADLIMTTKYTFAKIDPTQTNTFKTTTILFLNTPPVNADPLKIYSFPHPYKYVPMVWPLWNVTAPTPPQYDMAYGSYTSSLSFPSFRLYCVPTATSIDVYVVANDPLITGYSMVGVRASLTTYVFVDDLQAT